MFYGGVDFLTDAACLHRVRPLHRIAGPFNNCLTPGTCVAYKEKGHQNHRHSFQRGHLQGRCAAAKARDFASPSAFMRAAVEKELRGTDATLGESEQRIGASLEKYSKQVRRVSTGQQALFAYVDALAKVILSTLPDTDENTRKGAVARGKLRYSRFLKSVGANMVGDAKAERIAGDFPVVCVGGSAGGLDAYIRLLRHLPADMGVAVVIVNHLRTVATRLHEILPRYTGMPVQLIKERLIIQPNHVFIIPENRDLHILDGEFRLKPISKPRGWPDVITVFLRSLTHHWRGKLVAIIVSGYDGDGAAALCGIREVGGITIAQKPESAKQPDMPDSAIASGYVDFVLAPEDIAQEVIRIAHGSRNQRATQLARLPDTEHTK